MPLGGSGHAHTTNPCSTCSASVGDFRGHDLQLLKGRERNGLRGRRQGNSKGNSETGATDLYRTTRSELMASRYRYRSRCGFFRGLVCHAGRALHRPELCR
jgi:hypothetical protein